MTLQKIEERDILHIHSVKKGKNNSELAAQHDDDDYGWSNE